MGGFDSLNNIYNELPERPGSVPRTTFELPHRQLDQWPPPGVVAELKRRIQGIPHVRVKESRMAPPDTMAFWIPDEFAAGPSDAFIDDHEFCHLHALPQCSIHLTLPTPIRQRSIAAGWSQAHPAVRPCFVAETLVMVYGPRDPEELEIVLQLVMASYQFALGCPPVLNGASIP